MNAAAVLVVGFILLGLSGVACNPEDDELGACDEDITCTQFVGYGFIGEDIPARCEDMDAEFTEDCPLAELIGTCTRESDTQWENVVYMYGPYYTPELAEADCDSLLGIWAPAG